VISGCSQSTGDRASGSANGDGHVRDCGRGSWPKLAEHRMKTFYALATVPASLIELWSPRCPPLPTCMSSTMCTTVLVISFFSEMKACPGGGGNGGGGAIGSGKDTGASRNSLRYKGRSSRQRGEWQRCRYRGALCLGLSLCLCLCLCHVGLVFDRSP